MRHSSAVLIVAFTVLLRCGGTEARPKPALPPQKPELLHARGPDDSEERTNLLNFAHGAVVVSRTGEVSLQNSAQCAIDGDPATAWLSPPDEPDQSLLFALPARTRLRSVGVRIGSEAYVHPKTVELAVSPDGKTFTNIASFATPPSGNQISDVTPVESRYVRFNTRGGNGQFVRAISVVARGELLEPVRPGSLEGCWSINGLDASFTQRGASVTGTMAGESPMAMDGGSDGRFYRLLWIRGPEYGIAALAVTADGQHLSGMSWHEEAYNPFLAMTWFGEKRPCAQTPRTDVDVLATSMQRYGRYALYGLQFDDSGHLIDPASEPTIERLAAYLRSTPHVRIVAMELGQPDKARNQAVSQTKVDSVRAALLRKGIQTSGVPFVAAGSDNPHRPADTDAARSIYGAVELVK